MNGGISLKNEKKMMLTKKKNLHVPGHWCDHTEVRRNALKDQYIHLYGGGIWVALRAQNATVTPSSDPHVSRAVFFPHGTKHDTITTSEGMEIRQNVEPVLAISCAAKNLKFLPVAK